MPRRQSLYLFAGPVQFYTINYFSLSGISGNILFLIKQELPWMLESKLHDKFKDRNTDIGIDSEWFDLNKKDFDFITAKYKK